MSLTSLGHTVGTGWSHPERTGCCPCPPPAFREPENRAAGAAWRDPGGAQSCGTNPVGLRATGEMGRPPRRWVVRIYWVTEANCWLAPKPEEGDCRHRRWQGKASGRARR